MDLQSSLTNQDPTFSFMTTFEIAIIVLSQIGPDVSYSEAITNAHIELFPDEYDNDNFDKARKLAENRMTNFHKIFGNLISFLITTEDGTNESDFSKFEFMLVEFMVEEKDDLSLECIRLDLEKTIVRVVKDKYPITDDTCNIYENLERINSITPIENWEDFANSLVSLIPEWKEDEGVVDTGRSSTRIICLEFLKKLKGLDLWYYKQKNGIWTIEYTFDNATIITVRQVLTDVKNKFHVKINNNTY